VVWSWAVMRSAAVMKSATVVFAGSMVLALSSQICFPAVPVPFTMQGLAVLLTAAALGSRVGTLTVLAFLAEGACGCPVFAGFSAGYSVLFGPTGGYLLGFIPAVYTTGILLERLPVKNAVNVLFAGLAGKIILFVVGYLQLSHFVGFRGAYILGVAPFCPLAIVKLWLFTVLTLKIHRQSR
jgi:biotin transport system substrate-specific component